MTGVSGIVICQKSSRVEGDHVGCGDSLKQQALVLCRRRHSPTGINSQRDVVRPPEFTDKQGST